MILDEAEIVLSLFLFYDDFEPLGSNKIVLMKVKKCKMVRKMSKIHPIFERPLKFFGPIVVSFFQFSLLIIL